MKTTLYEIIEIYEGYGKHDCIDCYKIKALQDIVVRKPYDLQKDMYCQIKKGDITVLPGHYINSPMSWGEFVTMDMS